MTLLDTPMPEAWRKNMPIPEGYVTAAAFVGVVSYRVLDYWTRTGYLTSSGAPGHGYNRLWPAGEVRVARAMRRLIDAGISPDVAATIAREADGQPYPPRSDVRLICAAGLWSEQ